MTTSPGRTTFRVGVVGCGSLGQGIGKQFLAEPTATVHALADVSSAARSAGGEVLDVPPTRRYEDYESMFEDESLDGVVVATPHAYHHEQVAAALELGLHVLCEKPLVLTVEDAVDLRERAVAADRTLMVGYQRHHDSAFVRARERYRNAGSSTDVESDGDATGDDGEADEREEGDAADPAEADADADDAPDEAPPDIEFVTAEISQPWFDLAAKTWRAKPDLSGGGFTVDTGRHVIDALLWVTGLEPVAVDATMAFREPALDEWADVRIDFAEGVSAHVSLYGDAPAVVERHHVADDAGAVEIEGRGWGGRSMRTIDPDGTVHEPLFDHAGDPNKAEAFLESVREGTEPPATVEDAIRATAVVEAAYASAERNEVVPVDLPDLED